MAGCSLVTPVRSRVVVLNFFSTYSRLTIYNFFVAHLQPKSKKFRQKENKNVSIFERIYSFKLSFKFSEKSAYFINLNLSTASFLNIATMITTFFLHLIFSAEEIREILSATLMASQFKPIVPSLWAQFMIRNHDTGLAIDLGYPIDYHFVFHSFLI